MPKDDVVVVQNCEGLPQRLSDRQHKITKMAGDGETFAVMLRGVKRSFCAVTVSLTLDAGAVGSIDRIRTPLWQA